MTALADSAREGAAARLRVGEPAPVPDRGAGRRGPEAPRAGRGRRRPRGARPGRRPQGVPGAPRRCASTPPAACATSRIWRRRRTSSACAWPRSTRWSSGDGAAVVVASAAALAEKVPDPELRPHGFTIEKGGLIDLDETAERLVACGYERVDQVEDRGQFAIRGDILDVYPATEERAVRCELFDVEVERLRCFSTFTQRSLEEAERVEIAPAAELAPGAPRAGRDRRRRARRTAPRHRRGPAGRPLPRPARRWCRTSALVASPPRRSCAPALADHWQDVTTSFHDADAHHLYVAAGRSSSAALAARAAAEPVEPSPGTSRTSSAPRAPTPPPAR